MQHHVAQQDKHRVVYVLGVYTRALPIGIREPSDSRYQSPTPTVEFETLGTVFPFGRNSGAGSTINLGIRIIP